MLMDRIIGAFTFKREVYAEVEKDTSFTNTAWAIVAIVAVIVQIPGLLRSQLSPVQAIIAVVIAVAGFALGAFVIAWAGKTMFQANVNFEEMVRTLGLAYVWQIVAAIPVIGCLALILVLASWFIAAQEALDLDTGQTIITVVIGWIVITLVTWAAGLLGFGAAALTGLLSG